MTTPTQLIILNYTKVRDSAIVIHTLSREWGRRSFLVHIGQRASLAMFQPLSIVEADIIENPKSELWKARAFNASFPLLGIRDNLYKNSITMFMSEVLFRTIRDGANEDGLYEWCRGSILTLDALDRSFSNFHLRWLLEFCIALGFAPSAENIAPFAGDLYDEALQFLRLPFGEAMLLPLSGATRNSLCDVFIRYISHHTETSLNIRSLRVLRELFV